MIREISERQRFDLIRREGWLLNGFKLRRVSSLLHFRFQGFTMKITFQTKCKKQFYHMDIEEESVLF